MYESTQLNEFFEKYINAIKAHGHRSTSISDKALHCRKIAEFAKSRGHVTYSVALGNAFLTHFLLEQNVDCSSGQPLALNIRRVLRTVNTLNDFYLGLPFQRRYLRSRKTPLCAEQVSLVDCFTKTLSDKGYAPSSVTEFRRAAVRFLESFANNGINIKELKLTDIERLIASFYEFSPPTIRGYMSSLRYLLRFLYEKGETSTDWSDKLPYAKVYQKSGIPSVWPKADLERIFNIIDADSPIGKRNKVILFLAGLLGMRGCDIRNLKLSDIDWDYDEIRFVQTKTNEPVVLPLIPEVGEAIIDYLRFGRPQSTRQELVLRHNAPFEPFMSNTGFNNIIANYAQKAGVKLTAERKRGLHSLRHTFASTLLEQNVPFTTIAGLLGHVSSESVSVYLKTQDEALRECVLDIEEVLNCG